MIRKRQRLGLIYFKVSKIALDNIDEVIDIIKNSYNDAKPRLIESSVFTDIQAQAILDMRLGRLAGMEREKVENELKEITELIDT